MIAKTLFLMKTLHSYSVQNLRQEKSFRDHGRLGGHPATAHRPSGRRGIPVRGAGSARGAGWGEALWAPA